MVKNIVTKLLVISGVLGVIILFIAACGNAEGSEQCYSDFGAYASYKEIRPMAERYAADNKLSVSECSSMRDAYENLSKTRTLKAALE